MRVCREHPVVAPLHRRVGVGEAQLARFRLRRVRRRQPLGVSLCRIRGRGCRRRCAKGDDERHGDEGSSRGPGHCGPSVPDPTPPGPHQPVRVGVVRWGIRHVLAHQRLKVVHHGKCLSAATTMPSRDASSNIARSDASAREV